MNRKRLFITGIILIVVLGIIGIAFLLISRPDSPEEPARNPPVFGLAYCGDEQTGPCIVSFGIDADGTMLVNILLSDPAFPNFHLKIVRGESHINYTCQRIGTSLNNAYCVGEKLPPGESLHLILISTKDETILAEGDLSIIGLAYPTVGVAMPKITVSPTATQAVIILFTPTGSNTIIQPTSTRVPSYPNPSYPNPSYP